MLANRTAFAFFWVFALVSGAFLVADDALDNSISKMYREFDKLMESAVELGQEYGALKPDSGDREKIKLELTEIIENAFLLRQQLQREEIRTARAELDSVEKRISQREKRKDAIIETRVEDVLLGKDLKWSVAEETQGANEETTNRIQPGDTIAAYMEGVLPFNPPHGIPPPPPVSILESGATVTGYPLVVSSDGMVKFPIIAPIKLAGLSIEEAKKKIVKTYLDGDILRADREHHPILTLVQRPDRVVSIVGVKNHGDEPLDEPDSNAQLNPKSGDVSVHMQAVIAAIASAVRSDDRVMEAQAMLQRRKQQIKQLEDNDLVRINREHYRELKDKVAEQEKKLTEAKAEARKRMQKLLDAAE